MLPSYSRKYSLDFQRIGPLRWITIVQLQLGIVLLKPIRIIRLHHFLRATVNVSRLGGSIKPVYLERVGRVRQDPRPALLGCHVCEICLMLRQILDRLVRDAFQYKRIER